MQNLAHLVGKYARLHFDGSTRELCRIVKADRRSGLATVELNSAKSLAVLDEQILICSDQSARPPFMRHVLPQGVYLIDDGSEVMFNASEKPIWRKWPTGHIKAVDPSAQVMGIVNGHYFWVDDRDAPWNSQNTQELCMNELALWGVMPAEVL